MSVCERECSMVFVNFLLTARHCSTPPDIEGYEKQTCKDSVQFKQPTYPTLQAAKVIQNFLKVKKVSIFILNKSYGLKNHNS